MSALVQPRTLRKAMQRRTDLETNPTRAKRNATPARGSGSRIANGDLAA
jgi:hypothetical protein